MTGKMLKVERIAIFGATGMTGICVLKEALNAGFKSIKILLRDPSKLPEEFRSRVILIQGNVVNAEDVQKTVIDTDAIIVTLGTRNSLEPTTELSTGLSNIVTAMKQNSIRIISVCLSAFLFYEPSKVPSVFHHINEEHKRMLQVLQSSGLDYIAAFPPHIADNPKSEYVVKHGKSPGGRVISKYELADFLVKSLDKQEFYGKIIGLCSLSALPKD